MTPTPATRRLGAIPAALLVIVACWEIVATRCQATSVPGDDAWHDAATYVRGKWQPGDLIVFAPGWVDPVGRLHLGDLIPVEMAARMSAARYARIWELSIRGATAPDVQGLTPAEERPGPVTVRRYAQKPAEVVSDLIAVAAGRVEVVEAGFEPHRCLVVAVPPARPDLATLFELLDRVDDKTRAKLMRGFARLLPELPSAYVAKDDRDGKWVTVKRMPMGSTLAGALGIADVFTRRDERRDVALRVEIDGKPVVETSAPIDRWVPFRATTTPGDHELRFRLRWEAKAGELPPARSVCVNMEAWR
jgi:hypothetical protein